MKYFKGAKSNITRNRNCYVTTFRKKWTFERGKKITRRLEKIVR